MVTLLGLLMLGVAVGGPAVDGRVLPAWETLMAVVSPGGADVGEQYRRLAEVAVSAIVVEPLPADMPAGWDPARRRIVVGEAAVGEDARALSAVLAHELTHAVQDERHR